MSLIHDFRYAARLLHRSKGFALVAIATLALGIGANTAIFTLVNGVMLRGLRYPEPDRLMLVSLTASGSRMKGLAEGEEMPWSYPKFETLLRENRAFESLAGFGSDAANLTGAGNPERIELEYVTPLYFQTLGLAPAAGRLFDGREDGSGALSGVVVGEGLANRRFGGIRSALGRKVFLNRVPLTIAGIVPESFRGLTGSAEIWAPMKVAPLLMYPEVLSEAQNHWFQVVGRRRRGISPGEAKRDIQREGAAIGRAHPTPAAYDDGSVWGAAAQPLEEARQDPMLRRSLVVLFAAVGCVLLLACGNLASLLVARAAGRRHELAVRASLGASSARLRRQLLSESLLLSLLGGAAGLVLALWGTRAIVALAPRRIFEYGVTAAELLDLNSAHPDLRVLGFTLLVSLATGLLFGLVPAWGASRLAPWEALKESATSGGGRQRGRSILVAGEIGLALALVATAGLFLRSFHALSTVDLGFRPDRVLTFNLNPPDGVYPKAAGPQFHQRLLERISAIPGVSAAAVDTCAPLSSGCNRTVVKRLDGRKLTPAEAPVIGAHIVSANYFRVFGIGIARGRAFSRDDRPGAPSTIMVNETAAKRLWPGENPLGRKIALGMGDFQGTQEAEVVGIVRDVHYGRVGAVPMADAFLPDLQRGWSRATVAVKSVGNPESLVPALRQAVREIDQDLPLDEIRTMNDRVSDALSPARFSTGLLSLFAFFSIGLAALGIYGLMAQAAASRRREIGIRLALGATAVDIRRMMLVRALALTAFGVAAGLVAGAAFSRAIESLLFGAKPWDPMTLFGVVLFVFAASILASDIPARRAARVDPMSVLRQE